MGQTLPERRTRQRRTPPADNQLCHETPPGQALDVACGAGRHAIWLAERGWQVTAVDYSRTAIQIAVIAMVDNDPNIKPMNPAYLLNTGELRVEFEGWELIHDFEGKPGGDSRRRTTAEIIARRVRVHERSECKPARAQQVIRGAANPDTLTQPSPRERGFN